MVVVGQTLIRGVTAPVDEWLDELTVVTGADELGTDAGPI
jgi:hypothetical protein